MVKKVTALLVALALSAQVSAGPLTDAIAKAARETVKSKRKDVLAKSQTEPEDVVPFEKERAFFGKEERESRQVRAPRIDFGLGEVGVDSARREHVRAEPLTHVQARLKFAFDRCHVRTHFLRPNVDFTALGGTC